MATISDPLFRFATNVFDTDGTDAVYDISFELGYIDKAHVVAMSGVEDAETGLLQDITAHTVVFIDENDGNRVKVTAVPATGRKLIVFRQTDISDLLVKFQDGKLQTGRNLDLSATQLLMAIQEILDGLRINQLLVERQVDTVVDLNQLIQQIYQQVLELLAAGGIVSVAPRVWAGVWEGDQEEDESWPIPGADVSGAGFYDTYVNGEGLQPDVDYEIILDDDTALSRIRFLNVPAPGSSWFTVLRGYAKPYTGPTPITETNLRVKIIEADGTVYFADKETEYGLVRCTNVAGCLVTVREIPLVGPSETKMGDGSYMSFVQKGAGYVEITADPEVTITVPAGCLPRTRALNSVISLTCEFGDGNEWLLSGDLAKE